MINPRVEVEIARRYLVDNQQSFSQIPGNDWKIAKEQEREKCGQEHAKIWNTLPARILAASPHLQGYDVPGDEIDRLKAEGLTLVEALEELGM